LGLLHNDMLIWLCTVFSRFRSHVHSNKGYKFGKSYVNYLLLIFFKSRSHVHPNIFFQKNMGNCFVNVWLSLLLLKHQN
jgi:hypothetical protein